MEWNEQKKLVLITSCKHLQGCTVKFEDGEDEPTFPDDCETSCRLEQVEHAVNW